MYVINPQNYYKVTWDLGIGFVYLLSYILDPINFAFKFEPMKNIIVRDMAAFVTVIIIIDILLVPFSGTPKDDSEMPGDKEKRKELKKAERAGVGNRSNHSKNETGLNDPALERDIWKLTKNYLKGDATLDLLANIPQLIFMMSRNEDFDSAEGYEEL